MKTRQLLSCFPSHLVAISSLIVASVSPLCQPCRRWNRKPFRVHVPPVVHVSRTRSRSSTTSSSTRNGDVPVLRPTPWQRAASVDYSAVNEYVAAHYSYLPLPDDSRCGATSTTRSTSPCKLHDGYKYFGHTDADGKATEEIYNARNGYFDDDVGELVTPSLDQCGFQLVPSRAPAVTDWTSTDQIYELYLPKLKALLNDTLSHHETYPPSLVSHILFYQPMLRGESVDMGSKTSSVASLVHIDTDFGAHDAEGILGMVERNQITSNSSSEGKSFPRKEVTNAIRDGRRFAIINAWRGVNSDETPVQRAHLGLLSPRYASNDAATSLPRHKRCYPALRPDRAQSRWYTYPQMGKDEVLLFKQYDRRADRVSDIWHCSLPIFPAEERCSSRTSFDCRALVIYDEIVPAELDRYCKDRLKPVLSFEESGCFCDSQAEERRERRGVRGIVSFQE
mmetsp:Transcript_4134/g.9379  ORF Transcript_4134/g.9379 Transcript_4134/m.9379 type:complete len:451 (-) Transcript_4134:749-2101(-)|eukprot:CAMPEP_0178487548 /NCGR_PEP_ID=MMETSP0696-20121128/9380_1 /TAXON_ID=265572 /ORGANISM="Extubocellulus spinifer, Strain CCMP396" /LENGTH=450 /DNA_ID=CAMNT_0020115247 /DNA_START=138 /DNA_END=1490 /DNA_ORIENTATION=+